MITVEVDINIEFIEIAPSTSMAVALSTVDLDFEGFVNWRGRRWWRWWGRRSGSTGPDDTMVDMPVVGNNLLDDRRANFWLRRWRRWWRRWGWRGGRSRSSLFLASDDDFVSYDFAVLGWGFGARTADDKLLALSGDQVAAVTGWGWKAPLTTSNCQGTPFSARVSAITAVLSALCMNLKVAVVLLEADGAPLSRHVPTVAADFTA